MELQVRNSLNHVWENISWGWIDSNATIHLKVTPCVFSFCALFAVDSSKIMSSSQFQPGSRSVFFIKRYNCTIAVNVINFMGVYLLYWWANTSSNPNSQSRITWLWSINKYRQRMKNVFRELQKLSSVTLYCHFDSHEVFSCLNYALLRHVRHCIHS